LKFVHFDIESYAGGGIKDYHEFVDTRVENSKFKHLNKSAALLLAYLGMLAQGCQMV
jgi:hypothetical protein